MTSTDRELIPAAPTDHTSALRRALRLGTIALLALTLVSAAAWYAIGSTAGLWGALVGAGIGGIFVLMTAAVTLATAKASPQTAGAILLGTWLLKIIAALGVVVILKPMDFYSRPALAVTLVLAMVIVLGTETIAILKTRTTYVDPVPSSR